MALHILVLLAVFPEAKLTSENVSKSVGCNPVMVRSLFGKLKEAGLIATQRGTGGSSLARSANEITVWTVYRAVDRDSLENLIGVHPHPSSLCPVGSRMDALLEKPYGRIKDAMREAMEGITLQQLVDDYKSMNGS